MASVAGSDGRPPFHARTPHVGAVRAREGTSVEGGDEDEDEHDDVTDRCPKGQMELAEKCRTLHACSKLFRHHPPPYGLHAKLTPEEFHLQDVIIW